MGSMAVCCFTFSSCMHIQFMCVIVRLCRGNAMMLCFYCSHLGLYHECYAICLGPKFWISLPAQHLELILSFETGQSVVTGHA